MNRLLISCVGNQDPYSYRKDGKSYDEVIEAGIENFEQGKEGPIIGFCKEFKLKKTDSLILLYTKAAENVRTPTEISAIDTKKYLCDKYRIPEENVRIISLNTPYDAEFNPSDPVITLDYIRQHLQDALSTEDEEFDTCIISSSGTPQMQKALVLLVHSGFIKARLFQANGSEIKLEPLFEDQLLTEACNLIRIGNFGAAAEILKHLSEVAISGSRREVFYMLKVAAEGYRLWTGFEYQKSYSKFSYVIEKLDGFLTHLTAEEKIKLNKLSEILKKHQKFLKKVQNSVESRLLDIYQSAERHYFQKSYLEAIWRLDVICDVALIEATLRAIQRKYEIKFKAQNFYIKVEKSNLKELQSFAKQIKKSFYTDLRETEARDFLAKIDRNTLNRIKNVRRDLLSEMRNTAVHNAKPIYKDEVFKGLKIASDFVEALLNKKIITNKKHPLAQANLDEIASIFKEIGVGRF